ncbi:MAG TPA: polysaccharide biosynthesis/export family protein, partial [Bryobacteraceae bacterium]
MALRQAIVIFCAIFYALVLAAGQKAPGAVDMGANLPARPIGAGDLLVISVYGAPELSRSVRVGADGSIRLPMLKRAIEARGAVPQELELRIDAALAEERVLVEPAVVVTIAEYATRPIHVAGAVRHPLTFEATGAVTLLEALTRAEGLSTEAGAEILVTRAAGGPETSPVTRRIAVKDLFESSDAAANVILEGGEDVRVPEAGRVFVVGNVKKPGAFPVGETSGTSVLRALALAEGLTPYSTKQAYIFRAADGGKQEIVVEL